MAAVPGNEAEDGWCFRLAMRGLAEMAGVSAGDDGTEDGGDSGRGWRVRVAGAGGGCSRCRHFFVVKSGAGAYGTVQVNFMKEEVRK